MSTYETIGDGKRWQAESPKDLALVLWKQDWEQPPADTVEAYIKRSAPEDIFRKMMDRIWEDGGRIFSRYRRGRR